MSEAGRPADELFDRYVLYDAAALAPLFRDRGPLIYVLEFSNGDRYVGQTVNMTARYASHHRRWDDISAIQLLNTEAARLNAVERETIARHPGAGFALRNISFNVGHGQPTSLDALIPPRDQQHWALGSGSYDPGSFAEAVARAPGPEPRMLKSRLGRELLPDGRTYGQAVIDDLAVVVATGIPDAASTEQTYWTISDYPSTAGGRMATLTVGNVEVLYVPRYPLFMDGDGGLSTVLNISAGSSDLEPSEEREIVVERSVTPYRGAGRLDQIVMPLGHLSGRLDAGLITRPLRELVLDLMRSGTAGKIARWHSHELARRVYEVILRRRP